MFSFNMYNVYWTNDGSLLCFAQDDLTALQSY